MANFGRSSTSDLTLLPVADKPCRGHKRGLTTYASVIVTMTPLRQHPEHSVSFLGKDLWHCEALAYCAGLRPRFDGGLNDIRIREPTPGADRPCSKLADPIKTRSHSASSSSYSSSVSTPMRGLALQHVRDTAKGSRAIMGTPVRRQKTSDRRQTLLAISDYGLITPATCQLIAEIRV